MKWSILAALALTVVLSASATSPLAAGRGPARNECSLNSDCAEPLVCLRSTAQNVCVEQCFDDRDCGTLDPLVPSGSCRNVTYLRGADGKLTPTTTSVIVSAPGQTAPSAGLVSHNVCIQPTDPSWRVSQPAASRPLTGISVLPMTTQAPRQSLSPTLLTTEQGYSRMGGAALEGRFNMPSPSADLCRIACNGDAECRAYTYVSGGPGASPAGQCSLMSTVGAAQDAAGAQSGMKVTISAGQVGQDLPGKDHSNFETLDPNQCAQTCQAQPRWSDGSGGGCRAWTWVKSGVQGKNGRCWLKSDAGPWQKNPDTVSGLGAPQ